MQAGKKFTIPHNKEWKRPDMAFFESQEQAKGINPDELEWNGKYKRIRELRGLSIFGLSFYTMQEHSCFVQLNDLSDSPDAFLTRVVSEDTYETAPIEITFYGRSRVGMPKVSLLEKLSDKKGKFYKLPEGYWLLIHLGRGVKVDHQEISDKLLSMNAKFNAFLIQEVATHPDTVARFVAYTPKFEAYDVNVGGVAYKLSKTKIPGNLTIEKGKPPMGDKLSNS